MSDRPTILLVGTADTKAPELLYMQDCVERGGGRAVVMDVGVLAGAPFEAGIPNRRVAEAGGVSLESLAACGDENEAMACMARGAALLARRLFDEGGLDGLVVLGGTMGTDLALEVAAALPLGVPKLVVSTVAHSHLLPPDRISPDLMMILWSGGLYGLNRVCESVLAQAAGAVLGACRTVRVPVSARPLVGMTSLGKSCLRYMVALKPALEARGYELAVFHTTGMGGRAFESLASQRRFVAVLDFSLQEISNLVHGSVVTSGADRLEAAGRAGIPQIVAPGAIDMLDFPSWQPLAERHVGRPYHAHNRLIASVTTTAEERRETARCIAGKLALAQGPTAVLLPTLGIQEWDRPGEALHDPEGLAAFLDELRRRVPANVEMLELRAHINDDAFAEAALAVFDRWVSEGRIPPGVAH